MNLVYGFMQIVMESIPLSSSGHLIIMNLEAPLFLERFVHGPTIIVLLIYFSSELNQLLYSLYDHWKIVMRWLGALIVADGVTALVYYALSEIIYYFPLWLGFMITGMMLVSLRFIPLQDKHRSFHWGSIIALGCMQGFARLPGISRLGSTYVAGRWLGYSSYQSLRLSCALQLILFAGGFLQGLVMAYNYGTLQELAEPIFLVVVVNAMIIAYLIFGVVEWLMVNNKIWYLGIYLICLSFALIMK